MFKQNGSCLVPSSQFNTCMAPVPQDGTPVCYGKHVKRAKDTQRAGAPQQSIQPI